MIEYILALAMLAEPDKRPPRVVAPFKDHDTCEGEAIKKNQTDEELRTPEARALGAEYICLKVVRAGA